jgi:hypothetical protein
MLNKHVLLLVVYLNIITTVYSQDTAKNDDSLKKQRNTAFEEIKKILPDVFTNAYWKDDNYKLTSITLSHSDNADDLLELLKNFPEMTYLHIDNCKITSSAFKNLSYLTNLKSLSLAYTSFSDEGMAYIKNTTSLETLILYNTSLTDKSMAYMQYFKNLKTLGLNGTKISDEGLKNISTLSNLQALWIGRTNITDKGIVNISGMKNIINLDIQGTKITVEGLLKIEGLDRLSSINMIDTISGRKNPSDAQSDAAILQQHFPMLHEVHLRDIKYK